MESKIQAIGALQHRFQGDEEKRDRWEYKQATTAPFSNMMYTLPLVNFFTAYLALDYGNLNVSFDMIERLRALQVLGLVAVIDAGA